MEGNAEYTTDTIQHPTQQSNQILAYLRNLLKLLNKNTLNWETIQIQNGEMPRNIDDHQFFTHLKNVFVMGGYVDYPVATDKCYVIHIESADAQQITSLN